jgi:FkbM family methyltransferase
MRNTLRKTLRTMLMNSPVRDFRVRVRKGLAKGALWTAFPYSAYWRGDTEMDVEAAIRLHGTIAGGCCWDIGAHFGIYTVGMAMAVGKMGQVVAMEPDPISFARCQRHVTMNKLSWVKLFNAAASDRDGVDELLISDRAGETTSHLKYSDEKVSVEMQRVQIQVLALDNLVDTQAIKPPDFIKVDVEGHGARALKGALRSLSQQRPTLVMSFHSADELYGTKDLLEALHYSPFDPKGSALDWKECLYRTAVLSPRPL